MEWGNKLWGFKKEPEQREIQTLSVDFSKKKIRVYSLQINLNIKIKRGTKKKKKRTEWKTFWMRPEDLQKNYGYCRIYNDKLEKKTIVEG